MNTSSQSARPPQEESFAALFEKSLQEHHFDEGRTLQGKVVHIYKDHIAVDIGYKSEGHVPIEEVTRPDGTLEVAVGDMLEVLLKEREDENGNCILSVEEAKRLKAWDHVVRACEEGELVEGVVSKRVKGGLEVIMEGGVKAFLPGSQVDLRSVRNLDGFLGKNYKFKVIKFNKERGNIVLSRRILLEQERADLKEQVLGNLVEGQMVEGVIKNLTEYGAFVDLGGIDGLLHITDMSWGRVTHPSEMFHVGDRVRVKVLKLNTDAERVSLGLKQITEDPWKTAPERYTPGTVVKGKVISLKDYGAFMELEEGIEGLIHISEMSWTRRVKHPSKMVAIGDTLEAVVLEVDTVNHRIALGMKQLEPNPYAQVMERYPIGSKVKGVVRNITDFGLFVELEEGIDGLVHVSDMSWTQKVKHPSEMYRKGEQVEAVVLNIDTAEGDKPKISLGIKQLVPDPWDRIPFDYPVGKVVTAKIQKAMDFGLFVELEPGVDGLIHISELGEDRNSSSLKPGQDIQAEIVSVDPMERKIGLSTRSIQRRAEVSVAQGYKPSESGGATWGDLFKQKGKSNKKSTRTSETEEN